MIRVMIRQAAKRRGINTPAELARVVGVEKAVAGRWWKAADEKPFPRLESLDAICKGLKQGCDLGELVKFLPDKKGKHTDAKGPKPSASRKVNRRS